MACTSFPWFYHKWHYGIVERIKEEDAATAKITRYITRYCLSSVCRRRQCWMGYKWDVFHDEFPFIPANLMKYIADAASTIICDVTAEGTEDKFILKRNNTALCKIVRDKIGAGTGLYLRYRVYTWTITVNGVEETEKLATLNSEKLASFVTSICNN
jgi:hypothetical protein